MEDINDYWKMMEYPPVFTNIDWNEPQGQVLGQSQFIPMEYDQQKVPYHHQPFQRRRSSSVDLPINPLYSNTNRLIMNEPTIPEEEFIASNFSRINRIGSSATLEFPANNHFNFGVNNTADSPLSSSSSDEHNIRSPPPPPLPSTKPKLTQQEQQQTITFFPELHRTSYNTFLGKQLKQHQKRRRSSSLPPAFLKQKQQHVPTPLIFTQIQVTDPTPVHHVQKAAKVDTRPVAIERVHKPMPKPVTCDPVETQKKLEDQLIQLNFEDVTVAELKEMLRERGLPATGKKAILTDRLKDARDQLVKKKSGAWLRADSASPNLQGLANMTIHSPIPPNETLSVPADHHNRLFNDLDNTIYPSAVQTKDASVSPSTTLDNYQYQSVTTADENEIDINDIFNFDPNHTMLDDNAILFPPIWNSDDLVINSTEWDQDKLDLFLTELV